MKKMLIALLLGGALVVSVHDWFPTEARMADNELLQVQAVMASIDDEQLLPVDIRTAQVEDEQLLPVDTRTS